MRSPTFPLLLILSLGFFVVACGGGESPTDILAEATKARIDKDYQGAIILYQKLLNWKGEEEGAPTKDQRFQAALYLIECKIGVKKYDEAVTDVKSMKDAYGKKMEFKKYTHCLNLLARARATSSAIDVLQYTGDLFPEKKEMLSDRAEFIQEMGATPEDIERLKKLGYL